MKPMELWNSRPEYKQFDQNVFREHIYQEERKQLQSSYWMKRNEDSKKKKKKKNT
jgi:hypothetical protein